MGILDRFKKKPATPTLRRPNYRNSMVIDRIVSEEGLDYETAVVWFDEMLVFLDLCAASDKVISPSKPVDKAWHAFLLHSKAYEKYCMERFGKVVHHEPMPGEGDPEAYGRARRWREHSNFGPMDPVVWPAAVTAGVVPIAAEHDPGGTNPILFYGDPGSGGGDGGGGFLDSFSGGDPGGGGDSGGGGGDSGGGSSCGGGGCGGGGS
ncbi:MAG: hypothetical protein H0V29_06820 [Thermoleophilaceae bacterium]|nr:hypothetical protein [Thermoleophilaceae bacterium]